MKLGSDYKSLRAFLAAELSPDLCQKVAQLQRHLCGVLPRVNWVRPESIHLTLKFLGNVDPAMVEQLWTAIQPIRMTQAPINLEIRGLGVFPDLRRPRVLWVGCTGDLPALLNLVSLLECALEPLGFGPEKKSYHPHLTLARIKQDNSKVGSVLTESGLLEQPQNLGVLRIEGITLYRSDPSPNGVNYTALWTVPLRENSCRFST